MDDRSGLIYAGLDLYFTAILTINFVVLNKNSSPGGFFNGRERKDRVIVLFTKRADKRPQPPSGF